METIYDVDYFIRKFEKIPESKWICGDLKRSNKSCALGFCGVTDNDILLDGTINNEEGMALGVLFKTHIKYHKLEKPKNPYEAVYFINDLSGMKVYNLDHPRKRILAALYDIKAMQEKEVSDIVPKPKPEPMHIESKHTDITSQLAQLPVAETLDAILETEKM